MLLLLTFALKSFLFTLNKSVGTATYVYDYRIYLWVFNSYTLLMSVLIINKNSFFISESKKNKNSNNATSFMAVDFFWEEVKFVTVLIDDCTHRISKGVNIWLLWTWIKYSFHFVFILCYFWWPALICYKFGFFQVDNNNWYIVSRSLWFGKWTQFRCNSTVIICNYIK